MRAFLVRLPLFHPLFLVHCPTVTHVDLMVRVTVQLAWAAVGLSADLPLLRWKCEHNMGNSLHNLL